MQRKKDEEEARRLGMTYEAYKQMKKDQRQTELEAKEEAKKLKEQVNLKRNELSDWVVRFVKDNMKKHGQAIFENLLEEDPKAAASFLTQLMRFAAPTVADPDKGKDDKKNGKDEKARSPEYVKAAEKLKQMKKKFEKQ